MSNYHGHPTTDDHSQFESFASDLLFPLEIEERSEMYSGWIPMNDKSYQAYESIFDFDEASAPSDPSLYQPLPSASADQFYDNTNVNTNTLYYPPPNSLYDPTNTFGISSPISIPANSVPQTPALSPCFSDVDAYPQDASFSPSAFAAMHPLPRSISPTYETPSPFSALFAEVPPAAAEQWPQLTHPSMTLLANNGHGGHGHGIPGTPSDIENTSAASSPPPPSLGQGIGNGIGMRNAHVRSRQRSDARRDSRHLASVLAFNASTSAPSSAGLLRPSRPSSHARSISDETMEDREATVRRKKRFSAPEGSVGPSRTALDSEWAGSPPSSSVPMKSELKPPKLAPSAWQLYFTDWIQNYQATNPKKLNVAQAAKEAGQEYATLPEHEKDVYRAKSQVLKDRREREHEIYMRGLSPSDIKRENMFRAAQRKSGRSRKSNIKDPNAPKKPLSAYFMFLAHIRANVFLVREVFGDETETTKQSVLAAAKWRDMIDDERKPFLARAEREKLEYEAARRIYDNVTDHGETSITFSSGSAGSFARVAPLMMSRTTSLQTESSVDSDADYEHEHTLDRRRRY